MPKISNLSKIEDYLKANGFGRLFPNRRLHKLNPRQFKKLVKKSGLNKVDILDKLNKSRMTRYRNEKRSAKLSKCKRRHVAALRSFTTAYNVVVAQTTDVGEYFYPTTLKE